MNDFVNTLEAEFRLVSNPVIARQQMAYMKDNFDFLGLKSPNRREAQKPFLLSEYLPPKDQLERIIKQLWSKPEREFQYVAQELCSKYKTQIDKGDIALFEYMIITKSWWDTVDYIAANLVGTYFIKFPELRKFHVEKWISSNDIWLQRTAIIFQLKYKDEVDTEFLSYGIKSLLGSKEFFINKAIGWALRQYGKFNPIWVVDFCNNTELANLSRKEALRLIRPATNS